MSRGLGDVYKRQVIGISYELINLLVKGIEKKTGINVEIIIIWRLINTSISLLTFSIY